MAALPSSAEELYELVCTLQREHQSTELELRATQRRSESLRKEIHEHQCTILTERGKRQDVLEKLAALRLASRRQQAEEEGAAKAAQNAVHTLCTEQEKFLQICRRRALSGSSAASEAQCTSAVKWRNGGSDAPSSVGEEGCREATVDDLAATRPIKDSADAREIGTISGKCTPLHSGAAVHALLLSLRSKLSTCLNAVTTSFDSQTTLQAKNKEAAVEFSAGNEQPEPMGMTSSTPPTAVAGNPQTWSDDGLSCYASVPECHSTPQVPPPPVQPTWPDKKHIAFAPEQSLQRFTPVPAANANRLVPCSAHWTSSLTSPKKDLDTRGGAGQAPTLSGVYVSATKFTVRVASRSSTLLAEAAALGAKRRRMLQVTTTASTASAAADSGKNVSVVSSPRPSAAHPRIDNAYDLLLKDRSTVCLRMDAAVTSSAEPRESDTTRFATPEAVSMCGPRVSGSGSSRPRRTVWTWTRDAAQGEKP
ncbi:hypothetical protein ABL78_7275 [Leptomonas seymouri]|uniref:Uncharacterized protein n=1 Tax=Leptomonas seymouri TaxID=5684 RepID=A0A0N1HSL3_LEPSE|nr:hypothetical protein ABL78_7275 [Leptomonas seymouri]|eukprot:KPI83681.1 hypothetical protein ABL78_7275 [Leptomonas seymouri]